MPSADLYDPATGEWAPAAAMTEAVSGHTATLLDDGRVLVTGGQGGQPAASASATIYDPAGDAWTATASMALPRAFHTATRLRDGRVLVAGGQAAGHGPFQREAEVYDPSTGAWSPAGVIEKGRSWHAATLLADGRVLVTGGQGDSHDRSLRDSWVYDPAANAWTVVPRLMAVARAGHTTTRLSDGTVLVAGGTAQRQGDSDGDEIHASAELYDPSDGSFRPAASMATSRAFHEALTLPSGRVLVVAGQSGAGGRVTSPRSAELFDPAAHRWVAAGDLPRSAGYGRQTATLLTGPGCEAGCGKVLVVGEAAQLLAPPAADVAELAGMHGPGRSGVVVVLGTLGALAAGLAALVLFRRGRPVGRPGAAAGAGAVAERQTAALRRDVALLTDRSLEPAPGVRGRVRRAARADAERAAAADAEQVLAPLESGLAPLQASLGRLAALRRPRLLGKVEEELSRLDQVATRLVDGRAAVARADLAVAGRSAGEARRLLVSLGSYLAVALNAELGQAACSRAKRAELATGMARLVAAQAELAEAERAGPRAGLLAWPPVLAAMAEGWALAADVLGAQAAPPTRARRRERGGETEATIVAPGELETFADVGGLEEAKAHLRRTVEVILERGAEAAASGVVHNGVVLYGPPGTGKTLLARAVAGEYGLRFLRFSPALVGSAYQHEPARKLRQVFARAAEAAPCVLLLDEVDVIGGRRQSAASSDQRELATQLLTCLEDYRDAPGLVIMAATNDYDHLDPALREGRFDSRVAVPLPDAEARRDVLRVQLEARGEAVDWEAIDLDQLVGRSAGRSGAALAGVVSGAAERALAAGSRLGYADLVAEIDARSGTDRPQSFEDQVGWADVVLPEAARRRLAEVLLVFEQPELGRSVGVRAPAGVLLHGPPGTGKTTVARALASQVRASFYECSAAELMSKWAGESEQKVAQLFTRARANRPAIIFIDEVDALLRRRSADSAAPWEERVVSQFLRELDGLVSSEGVLLVGSTNRPDVIDEAVRDRRLVPIEIPLPDQAGRRALLDGLFAAVRLGGNVDLHAVAAATDGLSGADLKAVRDAAGMKALTRAAGNGKASGVEVAVSAADVAEALGERGVVVAPTPARRSGPKAPGERKPPAAKPERRAPARGTRP